MSEVEVDGEIIRVHGDAVVGADDRVVLAEILRAAKRRYAAEHRPAGDADG